MIETNFVPIPRFNYISAVFHKNDGAMLPVGNLRGHASGRGSTLVEQIGKSHSQIRIYPRCNGGWRRDGKMKRQLHRMQFHFHLSTQNICQKSLARSASLWMLGIYDRISAWTFVRFRRALSRVLRRERQPLLQHWQRGRAPCNLAAENRENRKVKLMLQIVKESGISSRFHDAYLCTYCM